MGKPNPFAPAPAGPDRRTFFKRSGSAALAVAVTSGAGPAALANSGPAPRFQHGLASGDPLADRVVLWTRVSLQSPRQAVAVRLVVAHDPRFRNVVARHTVTTDARRDFTVKIDASGLQPGTTYYYRFFCENEASPIGRTRTLPIGAVSRLRMAVVSCSNHAAGYFNAYARISERSDLDVVLHLGDYLYEYGPDQYGALRVPQPPQEMVNLADYRARHAQYKADPDAQAAHRQHPFICIWDDHEVTNDAWRDGAQNHTNTTEGDWTERVNVALQAYYEWMPVRDAEPAHRRQQQRAFRFGDLFDLFMLEERLGARSQQLAATVPTPLGNGFLQTGAFTDPSRTLLGAAQEAWLAQGLRQAGPRWKLIGQGVMFAHLKLQGAPLAAGGGVFVNPDQWDGYQPARDRLYAVLRGDALHAAVPDVLMLTGDIHSSWASDLTQDPNNPVPASGGYDAATGTGSHAVEFVTTSVSSPGLNDPSGSTAAYLRSVNPHIKFIDFNQRGYLLLDITPERVVGEWWFVDTVASRTAIQTPGAALEVRRGTARVVPSSFTAPRPSAPALAP